MSIEGATEGKRVHLGAGQTQETLAKVGHSSAFICKEKVGLDRWFLNWQP